MNQETFRSRLFKLLQKSRKALRLYSSMGRSSKKGEGFLSDTHLAEWREVNEDLLKALTSVLEITSSRGFAAGVYSVRDRFYQEWRMSESEQHRMQKDLLLSAEKLDLPRVMNIARELAGLKSRVQALQAVHQEIQDVINLSHVSQPAIALDSESEEEKDQQQLIPEDPIQRQAKVIPLRRRAR